MNSRTLQPTMTKIQTLHPIKIKKRTLQPQMKRKRNQNQYYLNDTVVGSLQLTTIWLLTFLRIRTVKYAIDAKSSTNSAGKRLMGNLMTYRLRQSLPTASLLTIRFSMTSKPLEKDTKLH